MKQTPGGAGSGLNNHVAASEPMSSAFVQSFALAVCTHCHGANAQHPDLSTMANMKAHWDAVIEDIDSDEMPRPDKGDKPLTACQKAVLHKWADLGQPETSPVTVGSLPECQNDSPASPAPVPVPVANPTPAPNPSVPPSTALPVIVGSDVIQATVLGVCLHCHSSADEDPELTSIAMIRSNLDDIVKDIDSNRMPKTRKGDKPLSDCQKAILHKWVDLGTPDSSQVLVSGLPQCQ